MICDSVYLLVFIRNLLVHLAEKILLLQPLTFGGDYRDTASMIFFLKTQAGWRETATVEHVTPECREAEEPDAVERLKTFLDMIAQRHNVAATLIARPLPDGGVELSVEDGDAPEAGNPP